MKETKQVMMGASVASGSGGGKKKREKVGNSHTWKRFSESRSFKRRTAESANTVQQLSASRSGSH